MKTAEKAYKTSAQLDYRAEYQEISHRKIQESSDGHVILQSSGVDLDSGVLETRAEWYDHSDVH